MLAVWHDWDVASILREAWKRGILLCGSSAGSICWFEEGLTDSIAGDLTRLRCLGFLRGSNCPHYDGEKDRRPAYQRLVGSGQISNGIAADDGVGLHFVGQELHVIVSARPNAGAYRVERVANGSVRESRLEARSLGAEARAVPVVTKTEGG
jgi:peptidase E